MAYDYEARKQEFEDRLAELSWMANGGAVRGQILRDGTLRYERLDDGKLITICLLRPTKPTTPTSPST
jgi:hypothetical protein